VKEWSESNQFDIAIRAPSSRHDAEPFFAAVFNAQHNCEDYSPYFAEPLCFRAGEAKALWQTMNAITSSLAKLSPDTQRVLIVDDVYSRGLTAAAIVHRLRTQGGLSIDARIAVFTPAWIPRNG
jgi:orotate phosphoribosyltransferase